MTCSIACSDAPDIRLIARLEGWLQISKVVVNEESTWEPNSNTLFDLERALHSQAWQQLTPEMRVMLDHLRKKIEVAHKLYRHYLPDLSRPAASIPLSPAAVQHLTVLLLKAALVWKDARYLNSALKLVDGVLGRDDCVFPEDLRSLAILTLDIMVPKIP